MKKQNLFYMLLLFVTIFFVGCEKEEDESLNGEFSNGAFILNEGAWGAGNSSVSFLDFSKDSVTQNIFSTINGRPLGDVLQSAIINNDKMYMVLNNSGKVEIAEVNSFKQAGTIEGLNGPRNMAIINNTAYITQTGDNTIQVADLNTFNITGAIKVGLGPEGVIVLNNKLWVANGAAMGGKDSTIMVIDPSTNQIMNTIIVGYNPKEMVIDGDGNIWVLCVGYTNWTTFESTPSQIVKINSTNFKVEKTITIDGLAQANHLDISNDKKNLFYGGGYSFEGIYALSITSNEAPTTPFIGNKIFYGFNVNPENGEIYCLESPSFTDGGIIYRYSKTGVLIKTYQTGIGPNSVIFN